MIRLKKLAGIVNESKIVDTQHLEAKIKRIKSKQPTGEYRGMRDMPKIKELFSEIVSGVKLVGYAIEDINTLVPKELRSQIGPGPMAGEFEREKNKLYQLKLKSARLNLEKIVDTLKTYIENNYSEQNP